MEDNGCRPETENSRVYRLLSSRLEHKNLNTKNRIKKLKYPLQPNEELQLDFHGPIEGPGPKRWILVGVLRFSKWPLASVVGSTSAKSAVKFMEDYITTYGIPEKIVTDQGTAFTGPEF